MTLTKFIKKLQELEAQGHGEKKVFGVKSSSGAAYEVDGAFISDYVGDAGPFDLEPDEEYVDIVLE